MIKVEVAGEDLKFTPFDKNLVEPLTGGSIAKLVGATDPNKFIVIQWLPDGGLETLRTDEKVQIEGNADLRFIIFQSATTYLFEIDERRMEWGTSRIRGDVLKTLAGVNPNEYGVWQQSSKGDDERIDNDKFAMLQKQGLEIFYTAKMESTEG